MLFAESLPLLPHPLASPGSPEYGYHVGEGFWISGFPSKKKKKKTATCDYKSHTLKPEVSKAGED